MVQSIIDPHPTATGGRFSVGYLVENIDGRKAFLKALDYTQALQSQNSTVVLESMLASFNFEVALLNKCKEKRLKRIVTPIAYGNVKVGGFGIAEFVSYIIFELAEGDIRKRKDQSVSFDLAWSLRCLHQSAVGLRQLHSVGITHQDLKPSNVLIFGNEGAKLADLGRASDSTYPMPLDEVICPGDIRYSPPEQGYDNISQDIPNRRICADIYMMGSLIFFYFTSSSAKQLLIHYFKKPISTELESTNFKSDLPYLKNAFQESLIVLKKDLDGYAPKYAKELLSIAKEMCEPDPLIRGLQNEGNRCNLEIYISRFDAIARRAEYGI